MFKLHLPYLLIVGNWMQVLSCFELPIHVTKDEAGLDASFELRFDGSSMFTKQKMRKLRLDLMRVLSSALISSLS